MAGSASLWLEDQVLQHTLGIAAMPFVPSVFMVLCAAQPEPTAATPGIEIVGNGYARQPAAFALLASPSNIAANTATISFPAATAAWGSIGFFELWSALTGGNRLYWGPLVDPADGITPITRNVLSGDIVRFTAGVIEVQAV